MDIEFLGVKEICALTYQKKLTDNKRDVNFSSCAGRWKCLTQFGHGLIIIPKAFVLLVLTIMSLAVTLSENYGGKGRALKNVGLAFGATILSPFAAISLIVRGVAGAIIYPAIMLKYELKIINFDLVPAKKIPPTKSEIPPVGVSLPQDMSEEILNETLSFLESSDLESLASTSKGMKQKVHTSHVWETEKLKLFQGYFQHFFCFTHFSNLPLITAKELNDTYVITYGERHVAVLKNPSHNTSKHSTSATHFTYLFRKVIISDNYSFAQKNILARIELKSANGEIQHGFYARYHERKKKKVFNLQVNFIENKDQYTCMNDTIDYNSKTLPDEHIHKYTFSLQNRNANNLIKRVKFHQIYKDPLGKQHCPLC